MDGKEMREKWGWFVRETPSKQRKCSLSFTGKEYGQKQESRRETEFVQGEEESGDTISSRQTMLPNHRRAQTQSKAK